MGKYSIHSTKEDYRKLYEKLEVLEIKTEKNLDWKKIKRQSYDSVAMIVDILERKIKTI